MLHMCACSVTQSCPTLCDSMHHSPSGPLSMGFSKQEYWSGLPFPAPRDLPNPGMEATSPALVGGFFTTEPPGMLVPANASWQHHIQCGKDGLPRWSINDTCKRNRKFTRIQERIKFRDSHSVSARTNLDGNNPQCATSSFLERRTILSSVRTSINISLIHPYLHVRFSNYNHSSSSVKGEETWGRGLEAQVRQLTASFRGAPACDTTKLMVIVHHRSGLWSLLHFISLAYW